MRTLAVAIAVAAGSLLSAGPLIINEYFLTVPQDDRLRSRMSPASASVSADGRFIALSSYARLAPSDGDDLPDIYVLDRSTDRLTLESGGLDDGRVIFGHPRLSADGRFVTFEETLPAREGRFTVQLVVRDRTSNTWTKVRDGVVDRWTGSGALSADGRLLVFASDFTNLTAGRDENGERRDVFVFDLARRAIVRASVDSGGQQAQHGESSAPAVSASGRYVVFTSTAALDGDPRPAGNDGRNPSSLARIYIRDSQLDMTRCVSRAKGARDPRGSSYDGAISGDGRYVAFVSEDSALAPDDRNRSADVFLHDVHAGSTILVSRSAAGGVANGASRHPSISADGRFVAFQSDASDLVCATRCSASDEDINLLPDVFLFDRLTGRIRRISADAGAGWTEDSIGPAISGDGSVIAFSSRHPIDAADINHDYDLFILIHRGNTSTGETQKKHGP